ncbi:MAG: hemerythrin [Bacteroidales bacterium]|nr:MAG: hemerythrin [Bacteroidales bacterium]
MNLFDWNENYSVNIKSIDEDHQGMFRIINQLYDAISHGKTKGILTEIIAQLVDYTKTHFRREELFFSTTNYPDSVDHKIQHELFIEKIETLKNQFEAEGKQISVELIKFLSDWLINHILISDKKYMVHLKKYGLV